MKTTPKLDKVSTLALAYKNGANYVLNGQTYAELPTGEGQLYRISEDGNLSPVSSEEWDELARMNVPGIHNRPQREREIPTE